MKTTDSNYPTRLLIPRIFASGTNASCTTIGDDTSVPLNFKTGFNDRYSADPVNGNGLYPLRADFNGIGKIATHNQFCHALGFLNEFDEEFCTKIGGYPAGAILDYLDGQNLHRVISLVDDNTKNYKTNGVDGTNWAILNTDQASLDPITLGTANLGEIDTTTNITQTQMIVCAGVTPRSGSVYSNITFGERVLETISTKTSKKGSETSTETSSTWQKTPVNESVYMYSLKMRYKRPTDSSFNEVTLCNASNGSSSLAVDPIYMPAGTLFAINFAIGGLKYKSITITTTLV